MSIKIEDVSKVFVTAGIELKALDHINLDIKDGEFVTIVGPARSGKSTLLRLLSGLEKVTDGHIFIDKDEITSMSEQDLIDFRDKKVPFDQLVWLRDREKRIQMIPSLLKSKILLGLKKVEVL
mgnify:CR=1 FL=1